MTMKLVMGDVGLGLDGFYMMGVYVRSMSKEFISKLVVGCGSRLSRSRSAGFYGCFEAQGLP